MLKTPILFIIFNRPNETRQVFREIQKAKPKVLYISSDGPRSSEEKAITNSLRAEVLNEINWDCSLIKIFHEKNLGCKGAIEYALNIFFEKNLNGIILEDDCLPSQTFFQFVDSYIDEFEKCENFGIISGNNFFDKDFPIEDDYSLSQYPFIWGWATSASNWQEYMRTNTNVHYFKKGLKKTFFNTFFTKNALYAKKTSYTWDYQFLFFLRKENKFTVIPKLNLVKNIGLGPNSTHTTNFREELFVDQKDFSITEPIRLQKEVYNRKYDSKLLKKILKWNYPKYVYHVIKLIFQ